MGGTSESFLTFASKCVLFWSASTCCSSFLERLVGWSSGRFREGECATMGARNPIYLTRAVGAEPKPRGGRQAGEENAFGPNLAWL